MRESKEIIWEIERLIDHYTPYRPLKDSPEAKEIRKVLTKLIRFSLQKKQDKSTLGWGRSYGYPKSEEVEE